jgi:hypothetical protein
MLGEPSQLAGQAEQYVHLHRRRPGAADQVPQGVHQRVGLLAVEEMHLLQRRPQLRDHPLLLGERGDRRRLRGGRPPSRLVWLFEERAVRAVLSAFGIEKARLNYYVHAMRSHSVTFPKRVDGKKYTGP